MWQCCYCYIFGKLAWKTKSFNDKLRLVFKTKVVWASCVDFVKYCKVTCILASTFQKLGLGKQSHHLAAAQLLPA